MDLHRQDMLTLGIVIGVVVGGGVVLATLLAIILAPLAPWLVSASGSSGAPLSSGPCNAQLSAASPAPLGVALSGAAPAQVSAASLSLQRSLANHTARQINQV